MEETNRGQEMRSAVNSAEQERLALEDIFAQDTGADDVSIESNSHVTQITLTYYTGPEGL